MAIDTPERRGMLLEALWELALRQIEGPDSQGAPIDPDEVWTAFKNRLAKLGLALDFRSIDGEPKPWPTEIDGTPVSEITRATVGPRLVDD